MGLTETVIRTKGCARSAIILHLCANMPTACAGLAALMACMRSEYPNTLKQVLVIGDDIL